MNLRSIPGHALCRLVLGLAAVLCQVPAQAVISCSVSSSGFNSVYSTTAPTANTSSGTAVISCTRAAGDANTVSYTLNADNGLNPAGQNNRAGLGASLITYELYRDAGFSQRWGPGGVRDFAGNINFGGSLSVTLTLAYYAVIPALQNVPAGLYTDTVSMTLVYGGVTAPASTFTPQVYVNTICQVTTKPGPMSFAYTSFQVTPAAASTPYAVRCTNSLPYTMALDATSGTMLGLTYNLSLSAPSAIGTGVAQNYSINGTIPANQVGTCALASCSATQVRSLTISY